MRQFHAAALVAALTIGPAVLAAQPPTTSPARPDSASQDTTRRTADSTGARRGRQGRRMRGDSARRTDTTKAGSGTPTTQPPSPR